MKVRTTAYNDHESDHLKYANASASGTALQSVRSEAQRPTGLAGRLELSL